MVKNTQVKSSDDRSTTLFCRDEERQAACRETSSHLRWYDPYLNPPASSMFDSLHAGKAMLLYAMMSIFLIFFFFVHFTDIASATESTSAGKTIIDAVSQARHFKLILILVSANYKL